MTQTTNDSLFLSHKISVKSFALKNKKFSSTAQREAIAKHQLPVILEMLYGERMRRFCVLIFKTC